MPELESPQWAATVKPGDTLVIGYRHVMTMAEAETASAMFRRMLPGVHVVLTGHVGGMAVVEGEIEQLRAENAELKAEIARKDSVPELRRKPRG